MNGGSETFMRGVSATACGSSCSGSSIGGCHIFYGGGCRLRRTRATTRDSEVREEKIKETKYHDKINGDK